MRWRKALQRRQARQAAPAAALPPAEVIRRLELDITRRLNGLLRGDYRGLVGGQGSEPGDTRPYQPGDDVRRIDWNVTARTHSTHVRETVADHELDTWIALDASASMGFGTAARNKADLAVACTAAVALMTARGGNRVGAVMSGPTGPLTVAPSNGRRHIQALLALADQRLRATRPELHPPSVNPGRPGDLQAVLDVVGRVSRRRALVVAVSDFLDPEGWQQPLAVVARRHDVVAAEMVDRRERVLPDVGLVTLEDPETGVTVEVQTADPLVRQRFSDAALVQRHAIAGAIAAAGADHLVLSTDGDWLVDLARFVARRRLRHGTARPHPGGVGATGFGVAPVDSGVAGQ